MFQQRLKELREAKGFNSQQSFADAFGVAQSTVGGWESGAREPNHETTKKLAQFFNVPVDYLLCVPGVINLYLTDLQQETVYQILHGACEAQNITKAEAIVRAQVSYNFFPRLEHKKLHQASEHDLLAVADFLGVAKEVTTVISNPLTLDDFSYAMYSESPHLSDEDKAFLIDMARRLSTARALQNGKVK